jgi:hypothetical protein
MRRCGVGTQGRRPARHPATRAIRTGTALSALLASMLVLGCAPASGARAPATRTPGVAPTPTSLPCPPATTGPSTPEQQRLAAAVLAAAGADAHCLDTTYGAQDRTATVTVTVAGLVPTTTAAIAAAQELSKVLCFRAQQALWTSGVALSGASVLVLGPILDPYVNETLAPYASADLGARTAATFTWAQLSPDAAWGRYDNVFLRVGFNPQDGVPTPTP